MKDVALTWMFKLKQNGMYLEKVDPDYGEPVYTRKIDVAKVFVGSEEEAETWMRENLDSSKHILEFAGLLCNTDDEVESIDAAEMEDNVNHPSHYETGKFECIDVMREALGDDNVLGFCLCNAFKYIYRCGRKNGEEDVRKANWYLNKYLDILDGNNQEVENV
jgi:hypothetical protein